MKGIKQRLRIAINRQDSEDTELVTSAPAFNKTAGVSKTLAALVNQKQAADKENMAPQTNQVKVKQRQKQKAASKKGGNVVDFAATSGLDSARDRTDSIERAKIINEYIKNRKRKAPAELNEGKEKVQDSFFLSKKDSMLMTGTQYSQKDHDLPEMGQLSGRFNQSEVLDPRIFKTLTQHMKSNTSCFGEIFKSSSQPNVHLGYSNRDSVPDDIANVEDLKQASQGSNCSRQASLVLDDLKNRCIGTSRSRDIARHAIQTGIRASKSKGVLCERRSNVTNELSSRPSSASRCPHKESLSMLSRENGTSLPQSKFRSNHMKELPDPFVQSLPQTARNGKVNSNSNVRDLFEQTSRIKLKLKQKLKSKRSRKIDDEKEIAQTSQPDLRHRRILSVIDKNLSIIDSFARPNRHKTGNEKDSYLKTNSSRRDITPNNASQNQTFEGRRPSSRALIEKCRQLALPKNIKPSHLAEMPAKEGFKNVFTKRRATAEVKKLDSSKRTKNHIKEDFPRSISPFSQGSLSAQVSNTAPFKQTMLPDTKPRLTECPDWVLDMLDEDYVKENCHALSESPWPFKLEVPSTPAHNGRQEEKQLTAAFTFNNDVFSKKNSIITFKDDYSNDKPSTYKYGGSGMHGRTVNENPFLDIQRKRSEQKPNGLATDRIQYYANNEQGEVNLIGKVTRCEEIGTLNKGRFSKLGIPRPDRKMPLTARPVNHLHSSSEFIKPLNASGLGSFNEGELDDSLSDRQHRIFESTESLLIKIQKEFNPETDHINRSPVLEKYSSLVDEEDSANRALNQEQQPMTAAFASSPNSAKPAMRGSPEVMVNYHSNGSRSFEANVHICTSRAEDDEVQSGPLMRPELDSDTKPPNNYTQKLDRAEVYIHPVNTLAKTVKEWVNADLNTPAIKVAHQFPRKNELKKSKKKRLTEIAELDIVSFTLGRPKLNNTDITKIECSEHNKAISIDDRELKSLFCLKSLDLRDRAFADVQAELCNIDRDYERESFIGDQSIRKPPKGAPKSHRDRITEVSPSAAGRMTAALMKNKLYSSGTDLQQQLQQEEKKLSFEADISSIRAHKHFKSKSALPLLGELASPSTIDRTNDQPSCEVHCKVAAELKTESPMVFRRTLTRTGVAKSYAKNRSWRGAECKEQHSAGDTYYLSSESQSNYKTKSSLHMLSHIQFDLNSNTKMNDTFIGQELYRSESGGNMLHGNPHYPDLGLCPNFTIGISRSGDTRKQKPTLENQCTKIKRFNFFNGSNDKASDADNGLTKFIQKQLQGIDNIRRITEEDESRGSHLSTAPVVTNQIKNHVTAKDVPDTASRHILQMPPTVVPLPRNSPDIPIGKVLASIVEGSKFIKSIPSEYRRARSRRSTLRSGANSERSRCASKQKFVSFKLDFKHNEQNTDFLDNRINRTQVQEPINHLEEKPKLKIQIPKLLGISKIVENNTGPMIDPLNMQMFYQSGIMSSFESSQINMCTETVSNSHRSHESDTSRDPRKGTLAKETMASARRFEYFNMAPHAIPSGSTNQDKNKSNTARTFKSELSSINRPQHTVATVEFPHKEAQLSARLPRSNSSTCMAQQHLLSHREAATDQKQSEFINEVMFCLRYLTVNPRSWINSHNSGYVKPEKALVFCEEMRTEVNNFLGQPPKSLKDTVRLAFGITTTIGDCFKLHLDRLILHIEEVST